MTDYTDEVRGESGAVIDPLRVSVFDIPEFARDFECGRTPRWLYHYTNPTGILGIASSCALWAGRPGDLNDRTEQLLIYEALDWQIRRILDGVVYGGDSTVIPDTEALAKLRADWGDRIPGDKTVYTVSLSEVDDSLDQWRAYCPRSGGVALGFPADALRRIARSQGFYLGQCFYGNFEEMKWFVDRVLVYASRKIYGWPDRHSPPAAEQEEYSERFAELVFSYLALVAPLFKHSSFESEREWRLVCERPAGERLIAVPSGTGLKQFLPLDLASEGLEVLGSVECVIGPNVDPDGMESALKPVLTRSFTDASVRRTASPYR